MKRSLLFTAVLLSANILAGAQGLPDMRNINKGFVIPDESYSDQPYVIKTDDGAWLCVMTTASGHEGVAGQHIISQRSTDKGQTWTNWVDVEPSDGPEASYAVLLKSPSGRIFVFYNHNTDNTREIIGDDPPYKGGVVKRVDCQGYFVFKYSDDHGRTWSQQRYTIPVREFDIDRSNPYKGAIRYFWNVGKAFTYNGNACVPLIKVGGVGIGFYTSDEGVLLQSPDLLTINDPANARWITLPEGNQGLKTPAGGGTIAEEHSFVPLSDGTLFCVYRTIDGFPASSYSRDGGRTWDAPTYMHYADGRNMKHPRAANFVWKCANGKYLYWYHNHGGRFVREHPNSRVMGYDDRNPAWLSGGVEVDTPAGKVIRWSQPEIVLYDDDPAIRISYPDLLEDSGDYYITETQKDIARVHKIDPTLLEGLWGQFDDNQPPASGSPLLEWKYTNGKLPFSVPHPALSDFFTADKKTVDARGMGIPAGFTIELAFMLDHLLPGQILLDTRTNEGKGYCVRTDAHGSVELFVSDGRTQASWSCDKGMIQPGKKHYVSFVVDAGPHIISVVTDGMLNDGGGQRQFGWGRFSPYLKSATGGNELRIGTEMNGVIDRVAVYPRAIRISEAVTNYMHWVK